MYQVPKTVTKDKRKMANKKIQSTDLWVEKVENCLCRDFTKRQLKILWYIMVLSFHNQKSECYIPTLSSFQVPGVSKHKIRNELEKLVEANIIHWNREEMIFGINTNYESWKIDFVSDYKSSNFRKMLDLNDSIIGPRR